MNSSNNSLWRGNNLIKSCIVVGDLVACNGLFWLLRNVFESTGYNCMLHVEATKIFIVLTLCYMVVAMKLGFVTHRRKVYAYQVVTHVLKTVVWYAIVLGIVITLGEIMKLRTWFFASYLISCLLAMIVLRISIRMVVKRMRVSGRNGRQVVFVGSQRNMRELYHEMMDDSANGYRVAGYFDFERNEEFPEGVLYLGGPEEVEWYLKANPEVQYLFCGLPSKDSKVIVRIIDYCENHLVHFYSVPNVHNYLQNRVHLNMIGEVPVLSLHNLALERPENKILKRAFDIVFSLLFLCTLFPFVFVLVAVVTKLTMPGPIFFRQKRNGLNDKEFYCLKFRSMKVNAQADTAQASKNDPRKTRWGEIMRKTSIDELPQFINVLLGDMSVVGPRPHMLKHTEEYSRLINKYMVRHFVKPGITGWSQVTGFRGETKELKDMEGRIRGDIWYLEHWSFILDLYIIYKTVANVFKGDKQAY